MRNFSSAMKIDQPIFRFLDTNGDGTGIKNMARSADTYYISPPAGQAFELHRMLIQIVAGGGMNPDGYGDQAALATGIDVLWRRGDPSPPGSYTYTMDLLDGERIQSNEDWARLCYDTDYQPYGTGGANKILNVRWTFARAGEPFYVRADEEFAIVINDNLGLLFGHYAMVQGVLR